MNQLHLKQKCISYTTRGILKLFRPFDYLVNIDPYSSVQIHMVEVGVHQLGL